MLRSERFHETPLTVYKGERNLLPRGEKDGKSSVSDFPGSLDDYNSRY